ncbi:hypothetical protein [Nocardia arizonensis]|uniref:hypothetical protein n=1 Tax=Nocardia arizonensis TaxID=1141647 RepID=UPI0012E2C344|nr:hypothetical protein [Nocardia arizonensis]
MSRKRKGHKRKGNGDRKDPIEGHLAAIGRTMRSLRAESDPLGTEVFAAGLVAELTGRDDPGEDEAVVLGFLETLAERPRPEFLALARTLATLAPTARARAAATQVAGRLSAAGASEPRWSDQLGQVRIESAHQFADIFGDEAVLVCTFTGSTRPHALIGFVDLSHPGGFLTDIVITTAIDKAVAGFMRYAADRDGLATFGPTATTAASALLGSALAQSYRCTEVPEEVLRRAERPPPSPARSGVTATHPDILAGPPTRRTAGGSHRGDRSISRPTTPSCCEPADSPQADT